VRKIADAQGELNKYVGFDVVKCNADEAARYVRRELHSDLDFEAAGCEIASALGGSAVLITRGADGMTLIEANSSSHLPAPHVEEVFDTVGAGDTVVAVVTLALCGGLSPRAAAQIANAAAGVVIRKVGNYAPSLDELREAL
jgi:bifunctional ADP-heptose synthase (sugar kinase/adenylyltransferase)